MSQLEKTELNWEYIETQKLLTKQLAAYVGNKLHSDMVFFIEKDKMEIPAHKFIVGIRSKVLHNMIYGTGNIQPSNKITIPNITVKQFQEVLNYIYSDIAYLTETSALPVMHVAHYLGLRHLENLCDELLLKKLSEENVCAYYVKVRLYQNRFAKECERVIAIMAKKKILFKALLQMAAKMCEENQWPPTIEIKRDILKDLTKLVRFDDMSVEEFSNCLRIEPNFFTLVEIGEKMLALSLKKGPVPQNSPQRYKLADFEVEGCEQMHSRLSREFYRPQ